MIGRKRIVHPRAADEHEDAVSDEEDAGDAAVVDDEEMKLAARRPDAGRLRVAQDGVGEGYRRGQEQCVVDAHLLLCRVEVVPASARCRPCSVLADRQTDRSIVWRTYRWRYHCTTDRLADSRCQLLHRSIHTHKKKYSQTCIESPSPM